MRSKRLRQRVVIVGGGFAGRVARRLLQRDFDVVLIDAKGYFEYVPSTLRCFVEPKHAKNIVMAQPEGTVIGTVVAFDANSSICHDCQGFNRFVLAEVTLDSGEDLAFDYCVMCSGSLYTVPIKSEVTLSRSVEWRRREIEQEAVRMATAERIVIVGGGTVGVELAAEIVGKWKDQTKHVTLITKHTNLLERMPKKAQNYAQQWMERHEVELVFGEAVVQWEEDLVVTESGRKFAADLCYRCIGFRPSTHFFSHDLPSLPVDPATLQVQGYENVFACGDCSDTREEKTAFAADLSAQLAAQNIQRHVLNKPLLRYPRDVCQGRDALPDIACISLYKDDAILQINDFVMTGSLAAMAKSQIEFMQLAVAREQTWALYVWNLMELSNIWISKFL